jgi:hypothetical protein
MALLRCLSALVWGCVALGLAITARQLLCRCTERRTQAGRLAGRARDSPSSHKLGLLELIHACNPACVSACLPRPCDRLSSPSYDESESSTSHPKCCPGQPASRSATCPLSMAHRHHEDDLSIHLAPKMPPQPNCVSHLSARTAARSPASRAIFAGTTCAHQNSESSSKQAAQ